MLMAVSCFLCEPDGGTHLIKQATILTFITIKGSTIYDYEFDLQAFEKVVLLLLFFSTVMASVLT